MTRQLCLDLISRDEQFTSEEAMNIWLNEKALSYFPDYTVEELSDIVKNGRNRKPQRCFRFDLSLYESKTDGELKTITEQKRTDIKIATQQKEVISAVCT